MRLVCSLLTDEQMDMNGAIPAPLVGAALRKMPLTLDNLKREMGVRKDEAEDGPSLQAAPTDVFEGVPPPLPPLCT